MQIQQDRKEKSKYRCTKKECAGLDRLNPLKSFFCPSQTEFSPDTAPDPVRNLRFFSAHYGHNQDTLPELSAPTLLSQPKTLQQPPFPWLLPQALGDSVKTGQREPMGLWVALSASVRDTVHTYRLLISRDKEVQPVPATANSLPYAVGRDTETKAPLFLGIGHKEGVWGRLKEWYPKQNQDSNHKETQNHDN